MFVYLIWKNKKGESKKALLQEEKAFKVAKQMINMGVDVSLSPEIITVKVN